MTFDNKNNCVFIRTPSSTKKQQQKKAIYAAKGRHTHPHRHTWKLIHGRKQERLNERTKPQASNFTNAKYGRLNEV